MKTKQEMNKVSHTPPLWKWKDSEHGSIGVYSGEEFEFEILYWDEPTPMQKGWFTLEQAKVKAAAIVRAVNSHEALLEAMKIIATRGGIDLDYATIGNISRQVITQVTA